MDRLFKFLLFLLILSLLILVVVVKAGFPRDPLHQLVRDGNFALIKKMVGREVDLESLTDYEQTPLHCATRSGNALIVKYLLVSGADVNAVDKGGNTSVMCAVAFDRILDINVLGVLLVHGADVNARNRKDESAIDLVLLAQGEAIRNDDEDVILTERNYKENRVRPKKIKNLLERGALVTKEQFEILFLPDQEIVCKRRRAVEEKLKDMSSEYVPVDLVKEAMAMLYSDREYNGQLKEWCSVIISE